MIGSARGPRRSSVTDRAPEQRAAGIAFERLGEGPPLVLIHGLGATREIWRPQLERLARERDVIAVDLPGFGASPILTEPPTPWALGAAVTRTVRGARRRSTAPRRQLARRLGRARDGQGAGRRLALPDLARRALAPAARPRNVDSRQLGAAAAAADHGRWPGSAAAREAMLRTSIGRPDRIPPADGRAMIAAWIDSPGYDAANAEMRRYVATDLDRITVPTTIVWGALDRLVAAPRPERRPPDSRFLQIRAPRPHAELGRPRPGRRSPARGELAGAGTGWVSPGVSPPAPAGRRGCGRPGSAGDRGSRRPPSSGPAWPTRGRGARAGPRSSSAGPRSRTSPRSARPRR